MKKFSRGVALTLAVLLFAGQLSVNSVFADELEQNTDELVAEVEEANEQDIVVDFTEEEITDIIEEVTGSDDEVEEEIVVASEEALEDTAEDETEELEFSEDDPTDSDGDGLTDYFEQKFGTDRLKADTDGDGLSDYDEIVTIGAEFVDPCMVDMDGDGVSDADEDSDGDGLSNFAEIYTYGTNPQVADSDNDGVLDGVEIAKGINPLSPDSDSDGATDGWELENGFDASVSNALFEMSVSSEDGAFKIDFKATGEVAQSVKILTHENDIKSDEVNTYSKDYEITTSGTFFSAVITFTNREVKTIDNPVICIYDANNETLPLDDSSLKTSVIGSRAKAYITTGGKFVLRSKTEIEDKNEENKDAVENIEIKKTKVPSKLELPKDSDCINKCKTGDADFNEDGISDELTKLLCDGTILTGDLQKVFGDMTFEEVQSKNDLDADGIINGDEFVLAYNGEGNIYATLISSPVAIDTDFDGINDADDNEPLVQGLKDGIVGSLKLIGRHTPGALFAEGHSYLVYTAYTDNQVVSIDNLYSYYILNPELKAAVNADESLLRWDTTVSELTEENAEYRKQVADNLYIQQDSTVGNSVVLNRGECVSIGNYTMASYQQGVLDAIVDGESSTALQLATLKLLWAKLTGEDVTIEYIMAHYGTVIAKLAAESYINDKDVLTGRTLGGVWMNREMYNQKYQYTQCPNVIYSQQITQKQLDEMLEYIGKNSYYNVFSHNCSTVSTGAWNVAVGYERNADNELITDANGQYVPNMYNVNPKSTGATKIFDLPEQVCLVLTDMAARGIPGYVGTDIPIVRGETVLNTVNSAVKTFKYTNANNTTNTTGGNASSTEVNTGSNSGSKVATSVAGSVAPTNTIRSIAATRARTNRIVAESEDEASEIDDEETEETTLEEELIEVKDEDVPLSIEEDNEIPVWVWILICVGLSALVIAGVVIAKKHNNK